MALTQDRNTPEIAPNLSLLRVLPVKGGEVIYAGGMVALNADGYAVRAAANPDLKVLGRAEEAVDNTSGADGDVFVKIKTGIFRYENATGDDEILKKHIGDECYVVDDETVARTDGDGNRPVAGKVFDVDNEGVWVKFEI